MDKKLLIAIPTYNRKKQLIRLLKSIEIQNCLELYSIVISDNCSNYSVRQAIDDCFNIDFASNIKVHKRPFNAGGDRNMSNLFDYVQDYPLVWTIGDDDEATPNSIKTIIEMAEKYPNIAFFKYPIAGNPTPPHNIIMKTMDDLENCIKLKFALPGDILFLSNNVMNTKIVKEYFYDIQYYSYCSCCHTLPLMRCLIEKKYPTLLCKDPIIKYNSPEGPGWNKVKIITSLNTIADIHWGNNHKDSIRFLHILGRHFPIVFFLFVCIGIKDTLYRDYVYSRSMSTIFSRRKRLQDYFAILCYKIEIYTHIKTLTVLYGKLRQAKEYVKLLLKKHK